MKTKYEILELFKRVIKEFENELNAKEKRNSIPIVGMGKERTRLANELVEIYKKRYPQLEFELNIESDWSSINYLQKGVWWLYWNLFPGSFRVVLFQMYFNIRKMRKKPLHAKYWFNPVPWEKSNVKLLLRIRRNLCQE